MPIKKENMVGIDIADIEAGIDSPELGAKPTMHMPESEQIALLTEVVGDCEETAGEAFGILVSHYHKHAVNLARLVSGHYLRDTHGAEDIVQDVWARIWVRRESLQVGSRFWKYVHQCITRAVRNEVRNARVRKTEILEMSPATLEDEPSWEPAHGETPEKLALQAELREAVHKTLDGMKPAQAELIRKVEFDGVNLKVYAEEMGVNYHTMRRRAQAAKKAMKEAFITDFPELAGMFAAESA